MLPNMYYAFHLSADQSILLPFVLMLTMLSSNPANFPFV